MFDGYIRDHARWTPRAPAVVTPSHAYAYAQFDADIDRFGAALSQLGVTRDAGVVSVCLEKAYWTLVAMAALARLRIASSPYNDPGASLRLIDREDAGGEAPGPRLVMLDTAWMDAMRAAAPRPLPVIEQDPDAVVRIMLSSGTTQAPRRVAMTWRRIEHGNLVNICTRGAGRHGTWVSLTSVEAMQGFTLAVAAWSVGAAVGGGIGVPHIPALMETGAGGLIGCTPAQLRALIDALPSGFHPQPQWRINAGGSRLPADLARAARLRLTPDILVSYGTTESPLNALGLAADLDEDPGLVGAVTGGTLMEILDDNGAPVPDGESGEIRITSQRVAPGYIDDPDATAERFKDGWFHTRDVGRWLPDGRLVLEGRVDERMNLGGRKFMPGLLEDAALACPGVIEAAAFAVPGPLGIDHCWLAVSAEPGFDRASLAPHLARYPALPPSRFAWVDEIPRNARGKVDRSRLRDAVLAVQGGAA